MGNRSLDDFLDAGGESKSDDLGNEPVDDEGEASTGGSVAVAPAVSTYVRDPDGGACDACGASVERRWRQDEDLVCPDCKEW